MAKIRIDTLTLENQAKKLDSLKATHDNNYAEIKSLILSLTQEWEGEANAAFMQSFNDRDPIFKQFTQDIESFSARMKNAANDMRAAEEAVKAKMNQL